MSDLLGVSGNAVAAYQLALATVSNNIANVSTEGYSRQSVDLRQATPRLLGGAYIGTGVLYDRIKRQFDSFAELNLRNSSSQLASQEPMVDYTNRIVDLMGSEDSGLVSALDDFFATARALSTDPASPALRAGFMRSAQGLASRFALISDQLDLVDTETREAVGDEVNSVNTLSQQLAAVNVQLSKHSRADSQPGELLDQRDKLLRELAGHVDIRVSYAANGGVTVSLGSSSAASDLMVQGQTAARILTVTDPSDPDRLALAIDAQGQKPRTLSAVTSGRLAGLLSFRDQVLGGSRNSLDGMARTVVEQLNQLHRAGVDGYGQQGGDLFTLDPQSARAADGVRVAIEDPLRVAAAAQFRVIEVSTNAGRADATVTYTPRVYSLPQDLRSALVNNENPAAARRFSLGGVPPAAAVGSIAAGMRDVTIYLNDAQGDQQLQLITRDGRHLLGSTLVSDQKSALLASGGMEPGATYSDTYRGQSGASGYLGMKVFYGARADVGARQTFDAGGQPILTQTTGGLLQGTRLAGTVRSVAQGAVTLNGVVLPALSASSGSLSAAELARWINTAAQDASQPRLDGVAAQAFNELRVPAGQLRLDRAMRLNGAAIVPPTGGFNSALAVVQAINARSADSGVQASMSSEGELVLTNTSGREGEHIVLGSLLASGSNTLNMAPATFTGRLEITRHAQLSEAQQLSADRSLVLDVGQGTAPGLLADLGFRRDMLPARLEGERVKSGPVNIQAGELKLNGVDLPALQSASLNALGVASWLRGAIAASTTLRQSGLTVQASNDIKVPLAQLRLDSSLVLNGQSIVAGASGFATPQALVQAINERSDTTQVRASLSLEGELVLTNTTGHEGEDIQIDSLLASGGNALSLAVGTYTGRISLERSSAVATDTAIELGFGAAGKPSMLSTLGLRTAAYLRGTVADDVLVHVTDQSASSAMVSASYAGSPADMVPLLRANPMDITFLDSAASTGMRYRIRDMITGTVLAERDLTADELADGIAYKGLRIAFSARPMVNDRFLLDGNPDGSGNNDNIRAMAALQGAKLFAGGKTLAGAYTDQVNDMGNLARQAAIAKDALTVVRDQAEESRDKVAGVNLDDEAANLIRFQQAYQASAKVMQVASQLFDSILQVR